MNTTWGLLVAAISTGIAALSLLVALSALRDNRRHQGHTANMDWLTTSRTEFSARLDAATNEVLLTLNKLDNRVGRVEVVTGRLATTAERLEARTEGVEAATQRLEERTERLEARTERVEAATQRLEERAERLEARTERLEERAERLEATTARVDATTTTIAEDLAALSRHHDVMFSRVFALLGALNDRVGATAPTSPPTSLDPHEE